jgi:hypothetical protein
MPDSKSDHVMKKAKVSTGSDKREKEQEKFYIRCPAYKSDGWIN